MSFIVRAREAIKSKLRNVFLYFDKLSNARKRHVKSVAKQAVSFSNNPRNNDSRNLLSSETDSNVQIKIIVGQLKDGLKNLFKP